jgi:predicted dehydrogenase
MIMVGFNRRFYPAAHQIKDFFSDVKWALTLSISFNAGGIPAEHWAQHDAEGGGRIIGEACHAVDLATFLTGSVPVRVYAESIRVPIDNAVSDDQCVIVLRHKDGSVTSIGYFAGGDKAFPKERIEVFGGGRVGVIDDFRTVTTTRGGKTRTTKSSMQKGHAEEIAAFADAVIAGSESPIPWPELHAVSLASILAVRSLREGVPFDI